MSRKTLYSRINKRVDIMLDHGLYLEKCNNLLNKAIKYAQSMQAIGYKELIPVINGQMIYEDAVNDLKQHSRQYAKRQMTWFKNKMSVH
ncbi:hypothetical protein ACV56Z_03615 [Staphylococcus aureus]